MHLLSIKGYISERPLHCGVNVFNILNGYISGGPWHCGEKRYFDNEHEIYKQKKATEISNARKIL